MALIVRIDVDRPYGKQGLVRHVASRIASDYFLPRLEWLRYLDELKTILSILNANGQSAYVFFRKCSYPSDSVRELMAAGNHVCGLHLENSRSEETFRQELESLEHQLGFPVSAFSKHGSGLYRYGLHHFAPYEPDRYLPWAKRAASGFSSATWRIHGCPRSKRTGCSSIQRHSGLSHSGVTGRSFLSTGCCMRRRGATSFCFCTPIM